MYACLNITALLERANDTAIGIDRGLYRVFYEAAERFCVANNVLVGGQVGLNLLAGIPLGRDDVVWDLYADSPFDTAKRLSNELYAVDSAHIPARTTAMNTSIKNQEFTIRVNARVLFNVYGLPRYRGKHLAGVIGPAVRNAPYTSESLLCIPEELQLIDIYRALYTPLRQPQWSGFLAVEPRLFATLRNIANKSVTGGAPARLSPDVAADIVSGLIHKLTKHPENADRPPNYIAIGDHAAQMLRIIDNATRAQVITGVPIEQVVEEIRRLLPTVRAGKNRTVDKAISAWSITHVNYQLGLPSDFRLTKHTVYIVIGGEQTPLVDVFNSATYEMIPWWRVHDHAIANPFVLMRFALIDIWLLRILLGAKVTSEEYIRSRVRAIVTTASAVREFILRKVDKHPADLFQLVNYVGPNIPDALAKKRMIRDLQDRHPTYYPERTHATNRENASA